jgi:hypothetical protein
MSPLHNSHGTARQAACESLLQRNTQDFAEEGFPGRSHQDWKLQAAQDGQSFEQQKIVLGRFAEADAWIDNDSPLRNPRVNCSSDRAFQAFNNGPNNVPHAGQMVHLLWFSTRMHEHDRDAFRCNYFRQFSVEP